MNRWLILSRRPLSTGVVSAEYGARVRSGALQANAAQRVALEALDRVHREYATHVTDRLPAYRDAHASWLARRDELLKLEIEAIEAEEAARLRQRSAWQKAKDAVRPPPPPPLSTRAVALRRIKSKLPPEPSRPESPRGLFMHGDVGVGKTMLMDLLVSSSTRSQLPVTRVHFNALSTAIFKSLHEFRQLDRDAKVDFGDTIDAAVAPLIGEARADDGTQLVCFDELQVADVVDAVILSRVFGRLFSRGNVVLVSTSNVTIEGLYKSGIRREDFEPFMDAMRKRCEALEIPGADYRAAAYAQRGADAPESFALRDDAAAIAAAERFLGDRCVQRHVSVPVSWGREVTVTRWIGERGAVFDFRELCDSPLAASDYAALAERFACVVLLGVPPLSVDTKDLARRFILLVDECHNHKCLLFVSAERPLRELFQFGGGSSGSGEAATAAREQLQSERDTGASLRERSGEVARLEWSMLSGKAEAFQFQRAVSRLLEMGTTAFARDAKTRQQKH